MGSTAGHKYSLFHLIIKFVKPQHLQHDNLFKFYTVIRLHWGIIFVYWVASQNCIMLDEPRKCDSMGLRMLRRMPIVWHSIAMNQKKIPCRSSVRYNGRIKCLSPRSGWSSRSVAIRCRGVRNSDEERTHSEAERERASTLNMYGLPDRWYTVREPWISSCSLNGRMLPKSVAAVCGSDAIATGAELIRVLANGYAIKFIFICTWNNYLIISKIDIHEGRSIRNKIHA